MNYQTAKERDMAEAPKPRITREKDRTIKAQWRSSKRRRAVKDYLDNPGMRRTKKRSKP